MTLYSEAVDRLFSARVAPKLWLAALAAYIASDIAWLFSETEDGSRIAMVILSLALLVAIMIAQWRVIRSMSGAPDSQRGSIEGCISWSILSCLIYVGIPIAIVVGIWGVDVMDHELASPLLTVGIAVMASLVSPMLVHTTGQVIGANGISFGKTLDGCRPFYLQLVLANAVISVGLWGAADVLISIVEPGMISPQAIILTIGSALLHFIAFILLTALMTLAWSKVSQQQHEAI
jgi:hypothetical protein